MAITELTDDQRKWEYYEFEKQPEAEGGHWLWTGKIDKDGYGRVKFYGKMQAAHRWVWECVTGQVIPDGITLDHICARMDPDNKVFLRRCVNPEHMDLVTGKENTQRASNHNRDKTTCPRGHRYTEANTQYKTDKHGYTRRRCRVCDREKKALRMKRKREAEAASAAS